MDPEPYEIAINGVGTSIFLIDNILTYEECELYKSVIDKDSKYEDDYTESNNVKCKYLSFSDTSPEMSSKILKLFEVACYKLEKYTSTSPKSIEDGSMRKIYGATRIHADNVYAFIEKTDKTNFRVYSMIIGLNNDYEGGELYFPYQNIHLKLKMGQCIIFPPYWTHPHGTNDLKNGTFRYTLNTWAVGELKFKV